MIRSQHTAAQLLTQLASAQISPVFRIIHPRQPNADFVIAVNTFIACQLQILTDPVVNECHKLPVFRFRNDHTGLGRLIIQGRLLLADLQRSVQNRVQIRRHPLIGVIALR